MPYTIIVCDDNSLYGSRKRKIMQREKLFNKLWILVPSCYNGYDMSKCTVTMRYLLPISREFVTEILTLSEERYEEYLKYVLPIDTNITKEWGDVELNLTFTLLDVDNDGKVIQRVRKTDNHILSITQLPDWDSFIVDSDLSALDQRIIKQDSQIKILANLTEILNEKQVDNLLYNSNEETLQLYANGVGVGDKVSVRDMLKDGIPIVDFSTESGDTDNNHNCNCGGNCSGCGNCDCEDDVVEFDEVGITVESDCESDVVEF